MSNQYMSSYWGVPSPYSQPRFRGIPVAKPAPKASPKVISVPVHFVVSERSRSDSALKIQKVLRGFLVRKNVRKIAAIRNEVLQIERRVSERETIELVRRDSRERLRISETLMNLLLRLDSVTSVDTGVRRCRKSVIKRAIALQDKLDLIAYSPDERTQDHATVDVKEDAVDILQKMDSELHIEAENCDRSEEVSEEQVTAKRDDDVMAVDCASELCGNVQTMPSSVPDSEVASGNSEGEASLCNTELHVEAVNCCRSEEISKEKAPVKQDDGVIAADRASELHENVEAMLPSVLNEVMSDSQVSSENPEEEGSTRTFNTPLENEAITEAKENEAMEPPNNEFLADECMGTSNAEEQSGTSTAEGTGMIEDGKEINSSKENEGTGMVQPESDEALRNVGRREEQNRDRVLLERMMKENEKMMGLMVELFERNEAQTRLLGSVSERVKQLERAFACEKLRKKKKRNAATATDGSGKLPDTKKCDKKH